MSSTQSTGVEKQGRHTACRCRHGEWSPLLMAWASVSWRLWNPPIQAGPGSPGGSEIPPSIKLSRYLSVHVTLTPWVYRRDWRLSTCWQLTGCWVSYKLCNSPMTEESYCPPLPRWARVGMRKLSMTTELDLRVPGPTFSYAPPTEVMH